MQACVRIFGVAVALVFLARPSPAFVAFVPPVCSVAPFTDVANLSDPSCPWIQQFKNDEITAGCAAGKYCPDLPVTRRQIAVAMERAMRGTESWDPAQGVYKRTVVVHPVPGDDIGSGQALLDALAGITDNAYANPYLLKIEPGRYNLNGASLVMKVYVDIEGSGSKVTSVYSNTSSGTVVAGPYGDIRDLEITASGNGTVALALHNGNVVTVRASVLRASGTGNMAAASLDGASFLYIFDSSVSADGNGSFIQGIGVFDNGFLVLHNSTVTAFASSGGGAQALPVNTWRYTEVYQSRLVGSGNAGSLAYGLVAQGAGGSGYVIGSVLNGPNGSAAVFGPAVIDIATTQLTGAPNNSGGTILCVGDFNGSLVALNASCL